MAHDDSSASAGQSPVQRLDRWLWFARLLKSRTGAAQLISDGRVRINRIRASKPSQTVRPGDVLTIAVRGKVQILKVSATGHRRGPPAEARGLYEVLEARGTDPQAQPASPVARRAPGSGRPSKRDRRLIDRLSDQE